MAACTEVKERLKKDHSRLVDGNFKKQGNSLMKLVLDGHKISRFLHPPVRIVRLYIEDLLWFSDVVSSDDLNSTFLSQGYVFETAANMEIVGGTYIPRTGGDEPPIAEVQLTGQPVVMTS